VIYITFYGNRDSGTGNNRLAIRRLTNNGSGGLTIGAEFFVTGQVQAALPSVAVNGSGVVGVFYYTFDGMSAGFPMFSAHFVTSNDHGQTFSTDTVLETFLSSATDNANVRQRVLGDYHLVKAVGKTFYGSFTGNGVPFGRSISNHDPIFYKVTPIVMNVTVSGRISTPDGRGLRNALVSITDSNNIRRTVTTSSFGFYTFDNVASGDVYAMSVASKLYRFASRPVQVNDNLGNVDFVGAE
jgi:hypothetical protein